MIYLINPITLLCIYILYTRLYYVTGWRRYVFFYPVLVVGALLDMLVNVTWGTVVFLDIPREWLLTKRTERLKSTDGWRGKLARLLCSLLNYFQKDHCA